MGILPLGPLDLGLRNPVGATCTEVSAFHQIESCYNSGVLESFKVGELLFLYVLTGHCTMDFVHVYCCGITLSAYY